MGIFDRLAGLLGLRKREVNVLVVGLDNSGKSTVLNHFKSEEQKASDIVPTIGFNVEKFQSKYLSSYCWASAHFSQVEFRIECSALICR